MGLSTGQGACHIPQVYKEIVTLASTHQIPSTLSPPTPIETILRQISSRRCGVWTLTHGKVFVLTRKGIFYAKWGSLIPEPPGSQSNLSVSLTEDVLLVVLKGNVPTATTQKNSSWAFFCGWVY